MWSLVVGGYLMKQFQTEVITGQMGPWLQQTETERLGEESCDIKRIRWGG